jgi:hypothetical protein
MSAVAVRPREREAMRASVASRSPAATFEMRSPRLDRIDAGAEQRVVMQITIEPTWAKDVRQAIAQACGERVEILRTQPVPRSTQVRVWLDVPKAATAVAMGAILRTLPYGEIGRTAPAEVVRPANLVGA